MPSCLSPFLSQRGLQGWQRAGPDQSPNQISEHRKGQSCCGRALAFTGCHRRCHRTSPRSSWNITEGIQPKSEREICIASSLRVLPGGVCSFLTIFQKPLLKLKPPGSFPQAAGITKCPSRATRLPPSWGGSFYQTACG